MRAVNLLPKEIQRQSAQKPVGPIVIGGVAILLCCAVPPVTTISPMPSDPGWFW